MPRREAQDQTTSDIALQCERCAVRCNPIVYKDGEILCRSCAGAPLTVKCPFCNGTGEVRA